MTLPYFIHLGGVALGLGIVLMTGLRWWFREKHRPGALIPFVLAFLYGMLAILAGGSGLSALGLLSWLVLWVGNGAGYAGLVWGVGGDSPNVTRGEPIYLTEGGYVVVFLLTVALIGLWRWAKRAPNDQLAAGILAGILLGLSGSVAGIAAVPLASAANLLGAAVTEML